MEHTKFEYDTSMNRRIIDFKCYPVNMVYDSGVRSLDLVSELASKPLAFDNGAIEADTPTIVEKET